MKACLSLLVWLKIVLLSELSVFAYDAGMQPGFTSQISSCCLLEIRQQNNSFKWWPVLSNVSWSFCGYNNCFMVCILEKKTNQLPNCFDNNLEFCQVKLNDKNLSIWVIFGLDSTQALQLNLSKLSTFGFLLQRG